MIGRITGYAIALLVGAMSMVAIGGVQQSALDTAVEAVVDARITATFEAACAASPTCGATTAPMTQTEFDTWLSTSPYLNHTHDLDVNGTTVTTYPGVPAASGGGSGFPVTDSGIHVPTNYFTMTPPAVGDSYTDPVFGTQVTRLTDATALSTPGIAPEYSQTSSFNMDDTYLVLLWMSGMNTLYDGSGTEIRALPGLHDPRWSRQNPNHLYYRTFQNNEIYRLDVVTDQVVTVGSFPQYTEINFGGGTGDVSDNERIMVFADDRYVFVYDLATQTQFGVLDSQQAPISGSAINYATISKDGDAFIA